MKIFLLIFMAIVASLALSPHTATAVANCAEGSFGCFEVIGFLFTSTDVGTVAGGEKPTIVLIQQLANLITAAIVVIGVIVIVVGGYFYMTAGGNAERVGKAKTFIAAALGGIALALIAVTILNTISPQFAEEPIDPQCGGIRLIVLRIFDLDNQLEQPGISNERRDQLNTEKRGLQSELESLYRFCPRVQVDNPFN